MNSKAAPILLFSIFLSLGPIPAHSQRLGLNTVVIDPGHGGKDAGCVSPDRKSYEKTFVLALCQEMAEKMRKEFPDVNVILTRDRDVLIPLGDRASKATGSGANLFISVHVNAVARPTPAANGFSAFILGPSPKYNTFDFNMEVCKRENSVIYLEDDYSARYGDFDSSSPESQIMLQLMANAYREQSLAFAEAVSNRMGECGVFKKSMGVMPGNFQVLRQASMPAVLLEFGFITNPDDLSALRSPEKRSVMVDNLIAAFRDYKAAYDASVMLPSGPETPAAPAGSSAPEAPAAPATPAASAAPAAPATPAASAAPAAPAENVSAAPEAPAAPATPAVPSCAEAAAATDEDPSTTYYGIQILASSRLLFRTDPYFKGNEVKIEKSGDTYKYITGVSRIREETVKKYEELNAIFPDSFCVKVDKNGISRF